jgi:Protein of unknown function (DUF1360)
MNLDTHMIEHMPFAHVIILSLFVYRLTRLVVLDEILAPVRDWVWDRKSPSDSQIGYLFTCPWCVSLWVALPVVFLYALFPSMTILVGCIFALSAIAGLITAHWDQ